MDAPRIPLATLPTPLHRLDRLSTELGAEIWIKRDDLTGFACGGNKVRKAEYLIADALSRGANAIITAGALQSNHARVIAAASARSGIPCYLVLTGWLDAELTGNVLLDALSQAVFLHAPAGEDRARIMARYAEKLQMDGSNPYVIPIGGSNSIGGLGYVAGFEELHEQLSALPPMETSLYFATSSGGTYGGLLAGKAVAQSSVDLAGVRVDHDPEARRDILTVANGLAARLGIPVCFSPEDLNLIEDHAGEGYGIPSAEGMDALRLIWRLEGILLDPVYTAKAMAGLIAHAREGRLAGKRAIFLHTGGEPSVFAAPPDWFISGTPPPP